MFKLRGYPEEIVSNRGVTFTAKAFKQFLAEHGIRQSWGSAFWPQTIGQAERMNQQLQMFLRCYVDVSKSNRASLLPASEFTSNNSTLSSKGCSTPFQLVHGYEPGTGLSPAEKDASDSLPRCTRFVPIRNASQRPILHPVIKF